MAKNKDLRTASAAVGGAGAAVGAGLDLAFPGVGTVVGGLSNAIASAIGLAQEPEVPDIDPTQLQMMGMGAEAVAELSAQSGMSASTVAQIGQIGRAEKATEALAANTLSAGMSPYDRKRIMDRLMERSVGVNQSLAEKIGMLDPTAEANRLRAVTSGSAVVGAQAERVADMRLKRQLIKDEYQANMATGFVTSMTQFMQSLNIGIDLLNKPGEGSAGEGDGSPLSLIDETAAAEMAGTAQSVEALRASMSSDPLLATIVTPELTGSINEPDMRSLRRGLSLIGG